jgi:hypothetical protein
MNKKTVSQRLPFVRNPDVVLREEDPDGALLFNPDTNQIRVLNATGLFVWKNCDGKKDLTAIVAMLKKAFADVPEADVDGQVRDFVGDMNANGFLGVPETE